MLASQGQHFLGTGALAVLGRCGLAIQVLNLLMFAKKEANAGVSQGKVKLQSGSHNGTLP
jgi:hypothetical protein